ncbi:DsbA family protein [Pseudodesulfovibrio sp. zrk46]|uniref:DsbA family oxidoreductase n=1 Tax=Pseudodesulfovibrio sp. zrk46 TaxID=2725288 RepID=UPI001FFC491C|nr:DsbA family protein [Pseudodesulfovibrio sp. zrk46]
MEDTWVPQEIHPETPPEGRPLSDLFTYFDIQQLTSECRRRGEPYGLHFGDIVNLSNTRLSLEAAEFARSQGRYHEFHHKVFEAYYSHGRDIGDMEVLRDVAQDAGLDPDAMEAALKEGSYRKAVSMGCLEARDSGVTAIPAFFIEDMPMITGAIPEDRFREILDSLVEE